MATSTIKPKFKTKTITVTTGSDGVAWTTQDFTNAFKAYSPYSTRVIDFIGAGHLNHQSGVLVRASNGSLVTNTTMDIIVWYFD